MAAPPAASARALRTLSQQTRIPFAATRSLHITGQQSAQPAPGTDITAIYRSRSLDDLRGECKRRNLGAGGSKPELVDRLANHDHLQSRAFSIAVKNINRRQSDGLASLARQFNTSRSHKATHDNSPVDFVYMPDLSEPVISASPFPPVPVFPDAYGVRERDANIVAPGKPEIFSVAGGNEPSPMTEVVDNHAISIDPFDLTRTVRLSKVAAEQAKTGNYDGRLSSVFKAAWGGFVEDIIGPQQQTHIKSK